MSGQMSAASQRLLGNTGISPADAVRRLLDDGLDGPPYPCTHPCKRLRECSDNTVSSDAHAFLSISFKDRPHRYSTPFVLQAKKSAPERHSRSKRPRESVSPAQTQPIPSRFTQQPLSGNLPHLPNDLYEASMPPSGLDIMQVKSAKFADSSTSDSDYGWQEVSAVHSHQLSVQSQQQHAAIAAFRPEWPGLSNKRRQGDFDSTASAAYHAFSLATDVQSFAAALSEHTDSTQLQQNPSNSIELPFPGMHTLELSPDYAQPAVYEAVQQLMQHPGEYLQAVTCCPLSKVTHAHTCADSQLASQILLPSPLLLLLQQPCHSCRHILVMQGEIKHAVTAADGYTYDLASICKWAQDHSGIVKSVSPMTQMPLGSSMLVRNHSIQSLIESNAVYRPCHTHACPLCPISLHH